jgi:hypothetical protein
MDHINDQYTPEKMKFAQNHYLYQLFACTNIVTWVSAVAAFSLRSWLVHLCLQPLLGRTSALHTQGV